MHNFIGSTEPVAANGLAWFGAKTYRPGLHKYVQWNS